MFFVALLISAVAADDEIRCENIEDDVDGTCLLQSSIFLQQRSAIAPDACVDFTQETCNDNEGCLWHSNIAICLKEVADAKDDADKHTDPTGEYALGDYGAGSCRPGYDPIIDPEECDIGAEVIGMTRKTGKSGSLLFAACECKSDDEKLGVFSTLEACAAACAEAEGCEYFSYGYLSKAGVCKWEKTTDASCSEGYKQGDYNFYALNGGDGSHAGCYEFEGEESLSFNADSVTFEAREHTKEKIKVDGGSGAVISAYYGNQDRSAGADVTEKVKKLLDKGRALKADNKYFGDPVRRTRKVLFVDVREVNVDGKREVGYGVAANQRMLCRQPFKGWNSEIETTTSTTTEEMLLCPEMAELQVHADHGVCHTSGRSIAELAVKGIFGDNVEIKSVRYTESGVGGFDLKDINLDVGLHPLTIEATDLAGNSRACTRHVRVLDSESPEWNVEPPLTLFSPSFEPGECSMSALHAVNSFEAIGWSGHAMDNCGSTVVKKEVKNLAGDTLWASDTSGMGQILKLGSSVAQQYQLVYTAHDAAANKKVHTIELVLKDEEEPTAIEDCPEDQYLEVNDTVTTIKDTWSVPKVLKDNCLAVEADEFPEVEEVHHYTPGIDFDLGLTPISYVIKDPAGNAYKDGCDFIIEVKRREKDPPWLKCPDDVVIDTEEDTEFGILPQLDTYAELNGTQLPVWYSHNVTAGMPFHFGTTHVTAHTETDTHSVASCTFKVTVNDKQRPKVDGRVYRCMDMDTEMAEPYSVCEGSMPSITKDPSFTDTHKYEINKVVKVSKGCCTDSHGGHYTCSAGGDKWGVKYCLPQ